MNNENDLVLQEPDKIKDSGESAYDRMVYHGAEAMSLEELLSVVVGVGTRLAASDLRRATVGSLMALKMTKPRAVKIIAALELGRRISCDMLPRGARIQLSRDIDAAFRPRLAHQPIEHFIAIPLDAKNRPIGEIKVASGSMSACPVNAADVFRRLVLEAAFGVIFVHNHPSGEPTPSADDVALTDRLAQAGKVLGIRVIDHIIIGQEGYFSFLDAGLLMPAKKSEEKL